MREMDDACCHARERKMEREECERLDQVAMMILALHHLRQLSHAAVVVDGDRWRIISDGGSVTKKVFLNGRLHATVLPPNGDCQPMDVLLERPDFTSLPPSPFNGEGIVGSGLTRAQHELIRGLDTR